MNQKLHSRGRGSSPRQGILFPQFMFSRHDNSVEILLEHRCCQRTTDAVDDDAARRTLTNAVTTLGVRVVTDVARLTLSAGRDPRHADAVTLEVVARAQAQVVATFRVDVDACAVQTRGVVATARH